MSGPFGSNIGKRFFVEEGIPVIRGNNLSLGMGRFNDGGFVFLTEEKAAEFKNCEAHPNDLLFTAAGTIGQVGIIPPRPRYSKYIISNKQLRARLDQARIQPLFAYYWLASPPMVAMIQNRNTGSTIPLINLSVLRSLPIPLPPLEAQDAIVSVLSALDDRITLLCETNATLEAIAQALFKSWFVDFDPVHAKQQGRAPEGMDEATAALFPDSFEESELGLVPRGWRYVSLKDVVSIFDSKRIPLAGQDRAKRQGVYPYYGAAALMDSIDDYLFDGVYLLTGEDGSVADPQGFPITQYVWGKIWVNNHAHVLQGRDGVSTEQVMLSLKRTNIQSFITGAVQAKLSQSNMWRIMFLRPLREISESFGASIEPLYTRLRHNSEQARTLATLRDTLLPRLISGQLRLPEAEAMLGVAA